MADYKNLKTGLEGGILTITVNRPDSLNALNSATLEELHLAVQESLEDDEVKGIIITGAGDKSFVAGADIKELTELNELNGRKFSETGQEVFFTIENSEKPIVAAINGFALGGGCELAMACHIRIASQNAKFGQPEVKLGTIPGYGGTQRLTQLVGKGRAMELMMTGDMIDAEQAKSYGLVNHVVPAEQLLEKAGELIAKIAAQAPIAITNIIGCVNAVFNVDENGYQTEANGFLNCCTTEDFKEGTTAFLEKREPQFKGS